MSFVAFASSHGLVIADPAPGVRIRRCPTEAHPRKKNGAWFFDGQRGWVLAWDGDGQLHWWNDPNAKPWSEDDKAAARARQERERRADEQRRAGAVRAARELIARAVPATHPYLQNRGFKDLQGLVVDEQLIVPMRAVSDDELRGAQSIRWMPTERRFDKKMLFGTRAKGAVFRLGPRNATELALCEGYATGLSIQAALAHMRLHAAVVVCFSAGNLQHVAPLLGGRRWVFADHDQSGAGEAAARATGLPFVMPDELGDDANDLHYHHGIHALVAKVMEARRMR